MLATTTTDTLAIVDPALLKKLPSSVPACLDLIASPIACSWSPDNLHLYIASSRAIHKYDSSSNIIHGVYDVEGAESIRALVSKEADTVIFSLDNQICFLQFLDPETDTVQTLVPHKTPVTSLSLSSDASLLASASTGVVLVHNLVSGTHTPLRGLGNGEPGSTSVTFHLHSRTRLLVSLARQILVYDTSRPSVPLKVIPLSDSAPGEIVALSCSPFSKTLVAVATSMGSLVMIDLEREKPQVRSVNTKTTPTALEFSPEGGAIYVGTEDGKLLVIDLRSLDKPTKVIVVSEIGDPIRTLTNQKKSKAITDGPTKTPKSDAPTATKTPSEPLPTIRRTTSSVGTSKSSSKVVASPLQRTSKIASVPHPASRRFASATTEGIAGSPVPVKTATTQSKKILSPVKDPLRNTHNGELTQSPTKKSSTPLNIPRHESKDSLKPRPSSSPRASLKSTSRSKPTSDAKELKRSRTLPSTKPKAHPAEETKNAPPQTDHLSIPNITSRPRKLSPSPSLPTGQSTTKRSPKLSASRPPSTLSHPDSRQSATQNPAPSSTISGISRLTTPSPDLSSAPRTPASKQQQQRDNRRAGLSVLGLGTPEVERWINAGKDNSKQKSKSVYFKDADDDHDEAEEAEELLERARKLSLQISPRRPPGTSSTSAATAAAASASLVDSWSAPLASTTSPSLHPTTTTTNMAGPSAPASSSSTAHDLLRTIIQDVMFDFQRETKAEMMGLHLDLLRMGRSWKAELRALMEEYVGDLREMREENGSLRRENERLRRGWQ